MLQAPLFECLSFDPFSCPQDGFPTPEVDVGRREIAQALVIPPVIIVGDEGLDPGFEIAWQEVVLQQDAVLQGLMPALDLALCLRVIGCSTNMIHVLDFHPLSELASNVTGAIVREQARLVDDIGLIAT